MTERRRLYTGDESAGRGLALLRRAVAGSLLLTALFILLFDRVKHDPGLALVSPFGEDPYDAVGSFGVQVGFACAILSALRAYRTDLKTESLYNRYAYTLRAMGVSALAVIVTMLADMVALLRYPTLWNHSSGGQLLVVCTVGLFIIASGFCLFLIRLARGREVCSKNPLRQMQIVPFALLLFLLAIYPGSWRDGIEGAILTAAAGMFFLFLSVALLSKAMFPCPDVPEKDLIDDLTGIYKDLRPRSGPLVRLFASIERGVRSTRFGEIIELLHPRKRPWNLIALVSVISGCLLAFVQIFGEGSSGGHSRVYLVAAVYIVLESAGIFLGYALLNRFLGLIRPEERAPR